jgi:uncharacterized protein
MSSANPKIQEPSMEEILASIRRIIADDQDVPRSAVSSPSATPAAPATDDDVLDLAELSQSSPGPARLELEHEDVSFRDSDGQIDFDSISLDEPELDDFPEANTVPAPPPVSSARPSTPPANDTLLSSAANATVSSAFGLLGATVLSNNARTLEDLVKELLRPMLKSWLDENLPPMVERLVRAEIERVSRGGR